MTTQTTNQPAITEAERRKRQEAVDFARASVGLEGFKISPAEEKRAARFIAGEIDLAEYVNARTDEQAQSRRQEGVDFARASVGLEGFKQHKDDIELSRRYVAGEISVDDAIQTIDEFAKKR